MRNQRELDKLQQAVAEFKTAITTFGSDCKLDTVGLDGWVDDIEDVMFDITTELEDEED